MPKHKFDRYINSDILATLDEAREKANQGDANSALALVAVADAYREKVATNNGYAYEEVDKAEEA